MNDAKIINDPVLGRMLSPDIAIQDEHNAQAYNRYSYCFNNPLRFTDPSGYIATIPPEFDDYYLPQYFDDFETYKIELEKLGAKKVDYNTKELEGGGGTVTNLWWSIGDNDYTMIIIDHKLSNYSQISDNSCVATSLVAQESRFSYGNPEITEEWLMSTGKDAYEYGLYADRAASELIKKTFVYERYHYFPKKDFKDYEGHAYREMVDDNGVFFSFRGTHGHLVNASMAVEFQLNGKIVAHEIRIWDAGLENGETVGFRSLDFYNHPGKLFHKMGILTHKMHYK